jgi:hypothetical protein
VQAGIPLRRLQDWRGLARTGLVAALGALLAWGVTEMFLAQALPLARLAAARWCWRWSTRCIILRRGSPK